jgi:hypothetical protein
MLRTLTVLVTLLSLTTAASAQTAPSSLDTVFAQPHTQSKLLHSIGVSGAPPLDAAYLLVVQGSHGRQGLHLAR